MDGAGFPLKPDGEISVDPRAQEAVDICDKAIINAKPVSAEQQRNRNVSFDAGVAAAMACLDAAGYDAEAVPATDGGGSVEVVWQPGERERPSFEADNDRCFEAASLAEARVRAGS